MSEDKSGSRATFATVVASAAVTVAVGITVAALGGYLVPTGGTKKMAEAREVTTTEMPLARPSPANVVLVPIAPDSTSAPAVTAPARPEPEVVLARHERRGEHEGDGDHRHGREHREREHEGDHDDD
jgi:hypothetical protein